MRAMPAAGVGQTASGFGRVALGLSAWTLFVWLNRATNVLDDRVSVGGELEGWSFAWRLGVAILFCSAAVIGACLVVASKRAAGGERDDSLANASTRFFMAFAVVGGVWWLIRGVGTLFADFSVGFKIVHTVLALVTIGLGLLVLRAARVGLRYG